MLVALFAACVGWSGGEARKLASGRVQGGDASRRSQPPAECKAGLHLGGAHRFTPSCGGGWGLFAGRSSAGALTFYAASETLALPGLRAFWEARKLASCRVQGGAPSRRSQTPAECKAGLHLGGAHRFTPSCGGGWGLFAGRSSAGALTFYAAGGMGARLGGSVLAVGYWFRL